MSENEIILEEWGKSLEDLEHLNADEAADLYRKFLYCDDEARKQQLRNRLITGTLYEVYKYIKNSLMLHLKSTKFDMNDIISTCCETWMSLIDEGILLDTHGFYQMMNKSLYSRLPIGLVVDRFDIGYSISVTKDEFVDLTYRYLNSPYLLDDDDYEKFLSETNIRVQSGDYNAAIIYRLIRNIALMLCPDGTAPKIAWNTLDQIIYILIDLALDGIQADIELVVYDDFSDYVIDSEFKKFLISVIDDTPLPKEEKEMMISRFGLDGTEPLTLRKLASIYGSDIESIQTRIVNAIQMIRNNSSFKTHTK